MSIGSTAVHGEGPRDADLIIVGEAPGEQEVQARRPFMGKSGQLLDRYLQRAGMQRDKAYLTNIGRYRPRGNDFRHYIGTPELESGLRDLQRDVDEINPNCILALGAWPSHFLTGINGLRGKGITKWRGSILPGHPVMFKDRKIVATVHPAYVHRQWSWAPIFHFDINRAVKDSAFPELNYPEYESIIDPDHHTFDVCVDEAAEAGLAAVDIETFPGKYSCIGFAYRRKSDSSVVGVVVSYQRPDLKAKLKDFWESDIPKSMQYGTYDVSFMRHFYDWHVGGMYVPDKSWDTYVAAASLIPEFPRGLDFLTSIYTRLPYYKTERQTWKEQQDLQILLEYNIKDTVATLLITEQQRVELNTHFLKAGNYYG